MNIHSIPTKLNTLTRHLPTFTEWQIHLRNSHFWKHAQSSICLHKQNICACLVSTRLSSFPVQKNKQTNPKNLQLAPTTPKHSYIPLVPITPPGSNTSSPLETHISVFQLLPALRVHWENTKQRA